MKTELEEAAKFNYDNKTSKIPVPTSHWINSEFLQIQNFKEGAKWQAERMYSEEDLRKAFRQGQDNMDYSETYGWSSKLTEEEWFEQFKKKNND